MLPKSNRIFKTSVVFACCLVGLVAFQNCSKSDGSAVNNQASQSEVAPVEETTLPYTTESWGANGDIPLTGKFFSVHEDAIGLFRPSTGTTYIRSVDDHSAAHAISVRFGQSGDLPFVFDAPGRLSRLAIYRNGLWASTEVDGTNVEYFTFGQANDIPVALKLDDNITRAAVFRPSDSKLYIRESSTNMTSMSLPGIGASMALTSMSFVYLSNGSSPDSVLVHFNGGVQKFENGVASPFQKETGVNVVTSVLLRGLPVQFKTRVGGDGSQKGYFANTRFGTLGDRPFVLQINNLNKFSVFRASTGAWYIANDEVYNP